MAALVIPDQEVDFAKLLEQTLSLSQQAAPDSACVEIPWAFEPPTESEEINVLRRKLE